MSFYYQASSSNSKRYFPSNSSSCFKLKLPFQVDGNCYEVALVNLLLINNRFLLNNELDRKVQLCFNGETHNFLIPCQKFNSIQELILCLTEIISEFTDLVTIQYTEDKKVLIKTINSELVLSETVSNMLGMQEHVFTDAIKYSKFSPSLDTINQSLFVCMDGVVPQLTGNGYLSYIQVIYPSNKDTRIEKSFSPIYLPLKPHRFDALHLSLVDNFGKVIDFLNSETQILIHFRCKNG